jgi:hypothetical protein
MREMRNESTAAKKQKAREEQANREKTKRDQEIRTYTDLHRQTDLLTSNAEVNEDYEDDFM